MQSVSCCVWLFVTPWTVAHQPSQSMEFSRQEYWSELPFPTPGIFLTQGSNLSLLYCRQILYCLSHQGREMVFHCLYLHPPDCWGGWAYYVYLLNSPVFLAWITCSLPLPISLLIAFLLFLLLLKDFVTILDPKSFVNRVHCKCFSQSVACLLNFVFQLCF